jgi:hypothetical protein
VPNVGTILRGAVTGMALLTLLQFRDHNYTDTKQTGSPSDEKWHMGHSAAVASHTTENNVALSCCTINMLRIQNVRARVRTPKHIKLLIRETRKFRLSVCLSV